jgi:hypothetical protein
MPEGDAGPLLEVTLERTANPVAAHACRVRLQQNTAHGVKHSTAQHSTASWPDTKGALM